MKQYQTEQEKFWAGEFGKDYISRNDSQDLIAANTYLFSQILSKTTAVNSVLELGANIGLNLKAIHRLKPDTTLSAVEINEQAAKILQESGLIEVRNESIIDFHTDKKHDFVFTKGVLIHIHPDALHKVYDVLYSSSKRYICVAEYYNPQPVAIPYRSHTDKLFKRDFCGEIMDKFPDLSLIDYGFGYHRDNNFPLDDITWFLLEKK